GQAEKEMKSKKSSVLASGNWYKIGVTQSGIHKITRDDLSEMGINVNSFDPRNIRIYGNRGGMLPEENDEFRYSDPAEHAIYIKGESDGSFDASDFILFYAEGTSSWSFNSYREYFKHHVHRYSDTNYYYINTGLGPGKRIENQTTVSEEPDYIVTEFPDRAFHEKESVNLIGSGREWYGEIFDVENRHEFAFTFPNIVKSKNVHARFEAAARSMASSSFSFSFNGNEESLNIASVSEYYAAAYAKDDHDTINFSPSTSVIDVVANYNKSTSGSTGWLNFIELNAWRHLKFTEGQMNFRDYKALEEPGIAEFRLTNADASVDVWNVTDPVNTRLIDGNRTSNTFTYRMATDTIHEFVAHDGSNYYQVHFKEKIENQNLHAIDPPNYLIISHSMFMDQAYRLASFHAGENDFDVEVVPVQKIFNEFSSGTRDISAIRDFIKMLYDKDEGHDKFRYVLLFGDGSFDNKERLKENTNFIPTWQSDNSLHPVNSYVTDDFFAYLDENEGDGVDDLIDIGIGRLPVFTVEQAEQQVDKIIHYASSANKVMGDWRNVVCFVADDEDGNSHMEQANDLATIINNNYPEYNIDKIFFDAYKQVSTPGGQRYPDASEAINNRVREGALFLNYTGHGGEVGWAHERVLEIADINSWDNYNKLPIFVTATCEFSRFDDPRRTSAGELVLLNEKGGSIAMLTTARATFGSPNFSLNKNLYENAFERTNGEFPRMGDLLYITKVLSGSGSNTKKFVLLGDPALQPAYPEYRVKTTSINDHPVDEDPDTLKALSEITINGEILDYGGNKMSGFDGVVHPSVYDKSVTVTTQGNDGGSPMSFNVRKNIIYRGKAKVVDGNFEFQFIVPKDIAYKFGNGKISYYASNGIKDANGSNVEVIIGGYNGNAQTDNQGPHVELFINDTNFVAGGITNENPILLAFVSDSSGINTIGNGIGHDIVAWIDQETDDTKVLNNFYEADLNTYKRGSVKYPFYDLEEGQHTMHFKVWDVYNNSAEKSIDFVVAGSEEFALEEVMNYPNPFKYNTKFTFEHNQPGNVMEVKVQIFSMSGELMKTIERTINSSGYRAAPISWNGTGDNGNRLKRGMYVYRILVQKENGKQVQKTSKLVILK
ncbi:MAG: type IX secretion system sortase PorU, partial [Bacteroidales bacterium]|nr:type IX secretion system sortase PorU [Bacteroidales bacterium]